MFLSKHPKTLTTTRVIKVFCLLVLLAMARQVLADCNTDMSNGWRIGQICTTHFDANGNYLESWCILDRYEDPESLYHTECKPGQDPGTCTGSNCENTSTCTWHGFCTDDFDCCGMNSCDLQGSHKCQDSSVGPPEN
jgi:hypothetical protein